MFAPIGEARNNSRIESSLGCTEGALRVVLCTKKSSLLAGTCIRKISSVACGFSPIKIHFSDCMKSLVSRIDELYVFFNKYFIEKKRSSFITICYAAITLVIEFEWFL